MELVKLKEPFGNDDIEWRVQQSGMKSDGKPWAKVLAYVTNRAIMDRLDEVCGPEKWKNNFCQGPIGGVMCSISIKIGDGWVTKRDGADKTDIEGIKGGFSGSMKRTAVQWGIGRYLYNLKEGWASFQADGKYTSKIESKFYKWNPPPLPNWALPSAQDQDKNTPPAPKTTTLPKKSEPSKYQLYLQNMAAIKKEIITVDGSDKAYYDCLKTFDFNKSDNVKDIEKAREIYAAMVAYVKNRKSEIDKDNEIPY